LCVEREALAGVGGFAAAKKVPRDKIVDFSVYISSIHCLKTVIRMLGDRKRTTVVVMKTIEGRLSWVMPIRGVIN
jgi:hypothetical protein